MSVDAPRTNPIASLLKYKGDKNAPTVPVVETEREKRKDPWFVGAQRPRGGQARAYRRISKRNTDRLTKKFYRDRLAQGRASVKHLERAEVGAIRAFEQQEGLEPGGLRQQLIDEGKLIATSKTQVGWVREEDIDGTVIEVPVYGKERPLAHSTAEILHAAGIDDELASL